MNGELLFLSFLSGFIYIITPGPVFLSLAGLVAYKGLRSGVSLVTGSLIGDIFWIAFAIVSLIFSYLFDGRIFLGLGLVCGTYLIYLGARALLSKTQVSENNVLNAENPFRRGLALGLLNPKSYPVLLATFAALIGEKLEVAKTNSFIAALVFILLGVISAYAIFSLICAAPPVKKTFIRYAATIVKLVGVIFICFGINLLVQSIEQFCLLV